MKMKYHLDRNQDGIVVLESEPQIRSLFVYSQNRNMIRVPLPYILFTVRYVKLSNGGFSYPGVYGSGLHVYANLKPLEDFSEEVFYLPTDSENGSNYRGLVCTDHGSDNMRFNTVEELVNYVVTLWWGHMHHLEYKPFDVWTEATLDQIPTGKWKPAGNFRDALLRTKPYGREFERSIPMEASVVDVQWPVKLTISPFEEVKDRRYLDMEDDLEDDMEDDLEDDL